MRDDERQRSVMLRTDVNEVNVQPIDLDHVLREGVQSCFDLAPVVVGRPIARECLSRRELHALRRIRDRFSLRPLRRLDAPAQLGKFRFRNTHTKRTNGGLVNCLLAALLCSTGGHGFLPLSSFGFLGLWFVSVNRLIPFCCDSQCQGA